jgi:hypothetical protein
MLAHQSGPAGATTTSSGSVTIKSGLPMFHHSASANTRGRGMSAGLPRGIPPSIHPTMVAISRSERDGSSLNFWMPTVRSTCHGGISRREMRARIDRAQGRTSSYEMSDIGPMEPVRWQLWQARCRIGATSLVNVGTGAAAGCAPAAPGTHPKAPRTSIARTNLPDISDLRAVRIARGRADSRRRLYRLASVTGSFGATAAAFSPGSSAGSGFSVLNAQRWSESHPLRQPINP